jgi:hypothetical protein
MQPPHSGESKYLRLVTKPSPWISDAELDFYLSILNNRMPNCHFDSKNFWEQIFGCQIDMIEILS